MSSIVDLIENALIKVLLIKLVLIGKEKYFNKPLVMADKSWKN